MILLISRNQHTELRKAKKKIGYILPKRNKTNLQKLTLMKMVRHDVANRSFKISTKYTTKKDVKCNIKNTVSRR